MCYNILQTILRKGKVMSMRKGIAVILILAAFLCCGCKKEAEPRMLPQKGDFSVTLPEGYFLGNIQEDSCLIFNEEGIAVGGIRLADLLPKELTTDGPAVPRYLDSLIPGSEYFCWLGSDKDNPIQYVSHQFTDPDTKERRIISRTLYVKDGIVYDLYLDTLLVSDNEISKIRTIVE